MPSPHALENGAGAADRAGRPVEGGEEAVAGGVHLRPAKARELARAPVAWWRSSSSRQARSPSATACSVESTMSVKSTVASTRSRSTSSHSPDSQTPVRNRSHLRGLCIGGLPGCKMSAARQLDPKAPGDALGHDSARPRRDDRIAGPVQDTASARGSPAGRAGRRSPCSSAKAPRPPPGFRSTEVVEPLLRSSVVDLHSRADSLQRLPARAEQAQIALELEAVGLLGLPPRVSGAHMVRGYAPPRTRAAVRSG